MKKLILSVVVMGSLTSCGKMQREYTGLTGQLSYKCSKHGVEYVQSNSGIALSVNSQGIPVKCN